MKNLAPNLRVKHLDRVGVIDSIDGDYAVVRFPVSPYPFPERRHVRVDELKRVRQTKQIEAYALAPF